MHVYIRLINCTGKFNWINNQRIIKLLKVRISSNNIKLYDVCVCRFWTFIVIQKAMIIAMNENNYQRLISQIIHSTKLPSVHRNKKNNFEITN